MINQPVALVTGASSGIGQATAELLAAQGFHVFGTSRTLREGHRSYTMLRMDVQSDTLVKATIDSILSEAGRIDLLVNNAGYVQTGAVEETTITDLHQQLNTNVFGAMRVIQAVLPVMRAQRRGRIINVGSVVGQMAPPLLGAYATSKFALEGLSEALRFEVRPFNIHVSLVEPSYVRTPIHGQAPSNPLPTYEAERQAMIKRTRAGTQAGMDPALVAVAIARIASTDLPRLRYQVGRSAKVLIMLKRLLPEPMFERVRGVAFGTPGAPLVDPAMRAT